MWRLTQALLSFVDFCNRKSLGFMHVNIRNLLPKFVFFTALAHSANPDVLAVSESWFRKTTKNSAAVILLFKGGDTLDPNCYRPISILPCLSKVFKNQVNKQTISNTTIPSLLCNLVSELVIGAPQPRSRS